MEIDEIVGLIHTLYAPNQDGRLVVNVQKQLQMIQKGPDATVLAHKLLQYPDQTVQFFGALTYTVYITNNEIDSSLADLLADEVIDACCKGVDLVVIQKLISNIGKIYVKLLYSPLEKIFSKLSDLQTDPTVILKLGLLSCKIIGEELNRCENINAENNKIIISSMLDITTKNILNNSLPVLPEDEKIKTLWLDCLQSWMMYVSKSEFDFILTSDLNDYFTVVINLLSLSNDIDSLNLISDVFDTNPSLINSNNKKIIDNLIFSEWTAEFISSNDLEDNKKLSRFITLFLDSDMIFLASRLIDPSYDQKFEYLLSLTNQPGSPISDESFSVDLLEFWILFIEAFINDSESINAILNNNEDKISTLNLKSKKLVLKLSSIYWEKAHLIDDLSDYEDEFINFRRDVGELFESLFSICRNEIFSNLINSIIDSSVANPTNSEINNMDTSLYLLTLICSILGENNSSEIITNDLELLFKDEFLKKIISLQNHTDINLRFHQYLVRNTIKFLSEISWFYNGEKSLLYAKNVLIFLFENLSNPIYQDSSSRAILMITNSCRNNLTDLLDDFESASNTMITNKFDIEIHVRSRIIRSYSSILQTVEDLNTQAEKISKFLQLIYNESITAYNSISGNENNSDILENIDNFLISMISSIVGFAKGLQIPEDWEDYYEGNNDRMIEVYNYWRFEDINRFQVHEKCLNLIFLYSFPNLLLPNLKLNKNLNPDIFEQVYLLFKSGLTEPLPGPFVIDAGKIINFIIECCQYCQSNNLPKSVNPPMIKIIELYGLVIKSNSIAMSISKSTNFQLGLEDLRMEEVINELLFKQFNHVVGDTDILQHIFILFSDILTKYPTDLIGNPGFRKVIEISIDQLISSSQQRFVVIALSKLWCNLIFLRKGKLEDVNYIKFLLVDQSMGFSLVYSLMKGFISTARSNVEFFSDIIRALTSKFSKYLNDWIIESFKRINIDNINENRPLYDEKMIDSFVKKLIVTRGQRVANRIIQEFWFSLTGLVDYGI